MIRPIKEHVKRTYFDNSLPLNSRIYTIFFFESYLLSILSATANLLLGRGILSAAMQWGYVAFCTGLVLAPTRIRLALQKPQLLFITFIYIPFLYFQTAGYDGTAVLFALLGVFLLAVVFEGRTRILVIASNIVVYLACIVINYHWPQLVLPHAGLSAKIADLCVALVLCMVGLAVMTVYITQAFENKNRELERLTYTDPLTGAFNRRFLTDCLQRELINSAETGRPLCVMMMDLDLFKNLNDTYGHGFGDEVLRRFYDAAHNVLREYDILARYGGEEFAAVLHGVRLGRALEISERVRHAVSELELSDGVQITVSIGVTEAQRADTVESILNRADACLYKAKQSGRNCVRSDRSS